MTEGQFRAIIEDVIQGRARIDAEIHSSHHQWIEERIEADRARKEMCWEITKSVAQWSVVGILGAVWYWLQDHWV